jgi:hypothetical protein
VAGTSNVKTAVVLESVEAAHTAHSVSDDIRARLGIEAPARRMDSQVRETQSAGDLLVFYFFFIFFYFFLLLLCKLRCSPAM